jgi:hypothetical protein
LPARDQLARLLAQVPAALHCRTFGEAELLHRPLAHELHCLLAYGALKGTPYNRIEERCRNKPSSYHLARVVQNALPVEERAPWTLDAIKSWVGQEGGE